MAALAAPSGAMELVNTELERMLVAAVLADPARLAKLQEFAAVDMGDYQARAAFSAIRNVAAGGGTPTADAVRERLAAELLLHEPGRQINEHPQLGDLVWFDALAATPLPTPDPLVTSWAYQITDLAVQRLAAQKAGERGRPAPRPRVDAATPEAAPHRAAAGRPRATEIGNGQRLARMYGHELRYAASRGQWFAWDGRRWRRDAEAAARRAKGVTEQLWREAAEAAAAAALDPDQAEKAKAAVRWATTSSKAAAVRAMLELARSEDPIATNGEAFDGDPFVLNVQNGTIDLRTGELRPHRQTDMLTMLAPTAYDPTARAPQWDRFLEQVLPDAEVRDFLQRYFGYALTGDASEQVLTFAYGTGANGKSVLIDVMLELLGDYGLRAAADLVVAKHGETHPTELADLEGKRLVVATEIEQGRAWAESTIKRITGDTTITARRMRMDFYSFPVTHKLVIAANTRPRVTGTDVGIWRRMRLVPFTVTIPEGERDRKLVPKLLAEREGILAWAVTGCLAWQRSGMTAPKAVVDATHDYQVDQDVLGHWIAECCVVVDQAWTATSALYTDYRAWAERTGRHPWQRDTFRDRLLERPGLADDRKARGRGVRGIGLLARPSDDAHDPRSRAAGDQQDDG